LLQKNFRAADVVTRYGGDEFLVIMPDTDLGQADVAVKRLSPRSKIGTVGNDENTLSASVAASRNMRRGLPSRISSGRLMPISTFEKPVRHQVTAPKAPGRSRQARRCAQFVPNKMNQPSTERNALLGKPL